MGFQFSTAIVQIIAPVVIGFIVYIIVRTVKRFRQQQSEIQRISEELKHMQDELANNGRTER